MKLTLSSASPIFAALALITAGGIVLNLLPQSEYGKHACLRIPKNAVVDRSNTLDVTVPGLFAIMEYPYSDAFQPHGKTIQEYESARKSMDGKRGKAFVPGYFVRDIGGHSTYFLTNDNPAGRELLDGTIYSHDAAYSVLINISSYTRAAKWLATLELEEPLNCGGIRN